MKNGHFAHGELPAARTGGKYHNEAFVYECKRYSGAEEAPCSEAQMTG
jgi:hypothetical protein